MSIPRCSPFPTFFLIKQRATSYTCTRRICSSRQGVSLQCGRRSSLRIEQGKSPWQTRHERKLGHTPKSPNLQRTFVEFQPSSIFLPILCSKMHQRWVSRRRLPPACLVQPWEPQTPPVSSMQSPSCLDLRPESKASRHCRLPRYTPPARAQ